MADQLVAVTGGSGRLGCSLVRALLARNIRVRVLELSPGVPDSLAGLDVELVHGSVTDAAAVDALLDGVDRVYHLAAKINLDHDRDGSTRAVNFNGTQRVAEACIARDLPMLHCSSHHALDFTPFDRPFDESSPLALNSSCPYHGSKAQAEAMIHRLVREAGLKAVIVNPGTLIGPDDFEPSLLGKALIDMYHGRMPVLLGIDSDCADARDVAEGIIAAAQHGRIGERYLLSGQVATMKDMAAWWEEATGKAMPRLSLPLWVAWVALPFTLGTARLLGKKPLFTTHMLRHSRTNHNISCAKAERELGYKPRPLRESFLEMAEFFKQRGWLG